MTKKPLNKSVVTSPAPTRTVIASDPVPAWELQWGPWAKWEGVGLPPIWQDSLLRLRLRCGIVVTMFAFNCTWLWGVGGTNERDIIEYATLKPH